MPYTIITPASTRQLTTLNALRDELGLSTVDAELALFGRLLNRASAAIERYCQRIFAQQRYEAFLFPVEGRLLGLPEAPIAQLVSVRHGADPPLTDVRIQHAGAGLLYREQGWYVTSPPEWTVRWDAGYVLPGQTTPPFPGGAALSGDVEQAALEAIKVWWRERDPHARVLGREISGQRMSFGVMLWSAGGSGLPPMARKILDDGAWRRVRIA